MLHTYHVNRIQNEGTYFHMSILNRLLYLCFELFTATREVTKEIKCMPNT